MKKVTIGRHQSDDEFLEGESIRPIRPFWQVGLTITNVSYLRLCVRYPSTELRHWDDKVKQLSSNRVRV